MAAPSGGLFQAYQPHSTAWDELFTRELSPHAHCKTLHDRLGQLQVPEFLAKRAGADLAFVNQGITFSVYSDMRGAEKIFPFDLIPRPVPGAEWDRIEEGLEQRIAALNAYGNQLPDNMPRIA